MIDPVQHLVTRAIDGDKEAFGDLYEQFLDAIYGYIAYRVDGREEAEDLTEMVFLKAWQALEHSPPREIPFRLWLFRIAHNAVVDHYRRRKPVLAIEVAEQIPTGTESLEHQVGRREEDAQLHQSLRRLKAEHQQVLACRFFAGLSHKETAIVMARDEEAIRALQYRALKALRQFLLSQEGIHV